MDEWDDVIDEADLRVYEAAGFGHSGGLGDHPALVVIDVQYRTVGHQRQDILSAIQNEYVTACGERAWDAIESLSPVIRAWRERGLPVLYPYVAPKEKGRAGRLAGKVPSIVDVDESGYGFVEEVAPSEQDLLIPKDHPSAFFGTSMLSHLIERRIDTLIIAGATTSGCVRATVVDAFALNFKVGVVRDAVFDRGRVSHKVNLFDMATKYADLMSAEEALQYAKRVERAG